MVADSLIKTLKIIKFREFRSLLGLHSEAQTESEFDNDEANNKADNKANI